MSHHKKPVKPSLQESKLFISHGFSCHPHSQRSSLPLGTNQNTLPLRTILFHPFTSQINLLLTNKLMKEIDLNSFINLSELGAFQYFTNFNLADLLDMKFAQTYLRLGCLVAMSISKVRGDDVFAIDGHGTIHMRLNQSTYQTLGLPGRRSKFGPPGQHFVVEIDMRDYAMRSGKPNYERIRKCLDNFPSSIFGDLLGPQYEFRKGRRWDVVMSWVDEKGNLQPIQPSTPTAVETCFPEINQKNKIIPNISKPDLPNCSVEALLDLYELTAEVILPAELTEERYENNGGRISALTIEATGFFHPFKLAELTQNLVKSYSIISITAHTAQFAPFSFLVNRMTQSPRAKNVENFTRDHQTKKKKKKGKSVMIGPERGVNAGPTSWTMISFHDNLIIHKDDTAQQNLSGKTIKECPDHQFQLLHSTDSIATNSTKRIKIDATVHALPSCSQALSSSTSKKHPWLIFESVGYHDTHC